MNFCLLLLIRAFLNFNWVLSAFFDRILSGIKRSFDFLGRTWLGRGREIRGYRKCLFGLLLKFVHKIHVNLSICFLNVLHTFVYQVQKVVLLALASCVVFCDKGARIGLDFTNQYFKDPIVGVALKHLIFLVVFFLQILYSFRNWALLQSQQLVKQVFYSLLKLT